jgi:uncharacterized protein (DUF58 family)
MSSTTWQFPRLNRMFSTGTMRRFISHRVGRWAIKRQGRDNAVTQLHSKRVYILPTGVGLVFALMTFAMLLGSMNYNNNLSFVLTFLLSSLGLVAMHQCQRNLVGLELAFAGVDPVFSGQAATFRIAISNNSKSYRYNLQIYSDRISSDTHDISPGDSVIFHLEIPTTSRGYIPLHRFGVRTLFPFELFRAWAWVHMDLNGLVYPHPAEHVPEPPATQSAQGHRQHDARGEEDFAGLRNFNVGDSPRQIAWKAFARSGELLSKQFSGADTSSQWFDFDSIEETDVEKRLSVLTRWIIDAEQKQQDYGLRMPGKEFPPGHNDVQRHACLQCLAVFGLAEISDDG